MKFLKWMAVPFLLAVLVVTWRNFAAASHASAVVAPAPTVSCKMTAAAAVACVAVLAQDPSAYGVTVAGMQERLTQRFCAGLDARADADYWRSRVDAVYTIYLRDGVHEFGRFEIPPGACAP